MQDKAVSLWFSYFLGAKTFLILYMSGFLVFAGWLHIALECGDTMHLNANLLSLGIYVFLAPIVYFWVKKILNDFLILFGFKIYGKPNDNGQASISKSDIIRSMFSNDVVFSRYKQQLFEMLNNKKEKYFVIIISVLIVLFLGIQDMQRPELHTVLEGFSFAWTNAEYISWLIYWTLAYSLLISVLWLITVIIRAFLIIEKEKTCLNVTASLLDLKECLDLKKINTLKLKIDILDISFRGLKAGLHLIQDFILSLSLKIAFIGAFCSFPALLYFLFTRKVLPVWYALCVFCCLLSIGVFVLGQYGVWKLWTNSKKEAVLSIDHFFSDITKRLNNLSTKKARSLESIREFTDDLNNMTTITYTSSSVFKIISANFFVFGPVIVEYLLRILLGW